MLATLIASVLIPVPRPVPPPPDPYSKALWFVESAEAIARYSHQRAVDDFLSGLRAPTVAPEPSAAPSGSQSAGPHSDAFWRGVSVCEQSGLDNPTYGYFSVMDGSAAGKSWSEQVAIANGIISRYGDSAWAASCVAAGYGASPSG